MELIKLALSFLTNATTTNDDKEQRKNINAFKRHRRKIYRDFKKKPKATTNFDNSHYVIKISGIWETVDEVGLAIKLVVACPP